MSESKENAKLTEENKLLKIENKKLNKQVEKISIKIEKLTDIMCEKYNIIDNFYKSEIEKTNDTKYNKIIATNKELQNKNNILWDKYDILFNKNKELEQKLFEKFQENEDLNNQIEKMKSCRNCTHSNYKHALIFCDEEESPVLCKRYTNYDLSKLPDLWELKND